MNIVTLTEEQESLITKYTSLAVNLVYTIDLDTIPDEHKQFVNTVVGKRNESSMPSMAPTLNKERGNTKKTRKTFHKTPEKLTINRFGLDIDITYKNGSNDQLWKMYNLMMNQYDNGTHTTRSQLMSLFKANGDNHSQASAHVRALVEKGAIAEGHVPKHGLTVGSLGCIAEAA